MAPAPEAKSVSAPPDGGWGWMVVCGAFISIGFSYAMPKAISVLFLEIQETFHVRYSDIAWISSIMLAAMYAGGPVSSLLVTRFGSRPMVIVGGLMCGVSFIVASLANSIIHLYLTVGVIGGFGLAFNLNASVTIIGKYFLARRPLANGLAMAGSPVFLCFLAPLNGFLLHHFGWRGSLFILGAVLLNCCVAGALMRPIAAPGNPPAEEASHKVATAGETNGTNTTKLRGGCMSHVNKLLDFSLFKHRGFVIYLVGNMFFFFTAYAPIIYLSSLAVSVGVDDYLATYLLSVMGFVDMFVRPGTGLLANSKWIRPRVQYFLSFAMVFTGSVHLLCPLATSYAALVVYAAFFGIGFGMVFALVFECLMDLMGPERFPRAVGMVTILECCPMLLGPPSAGALVDIFHGYKYIYLMCGSLTLCGGLFLFVMNAYNYHMLAKERRTTEEGQEDHLAKDLPAQERASSSHTELEERRPSQETAAADTTEPDAAAAGEDAVPKELTPTGEVDPRPEVTEMPSKP